MVVTLRLKAQPPQKRLFQLETLKTVRQGRLEERLVADWEGGYGTVRATLCALSFRSLVRPFSAEKVVRIAFHNDRCARGSSFVPVQTLLFHRVGLSARFRPVGGGGCCGRASYGSTVRRKLPGASSFPPERKMKRTNEKCSPSSHPGAALVRLPFRERERGGQLRSKRCPKPTPIESDSGKSAGRGRLQTRCRVKSEFCLSFPRATVGKQLRHRRIEC